ncbi:MAG: TraB/GumN family protein [Rhodobacteraceae bacterium]|nr:TraB/GumN family protein [Paracoccaceae bacterium]
MLRCLAILFALALPGAVSAACDGQDLIDTLSDQERAELDAQVAATVYPEGLLWRATREDGTEITIFGTYHFRHEQTDAHLEALKPMIEAADQVYLEISNEDQAQMQRDMAEDPSIMFITEGPTLPDLLGEADWQAFSEQMKARNIPAFMAAKFKPLWATMMLGIGPCEARSGALEAHGIDKLVGDYAAEIGNPSRSLEQFGELMRLLDEEPVEKQIDLIRLTLAWPGDTDDLSYTIRQRYLAEEIALTWEFSRLISLKYGGPTAEEDFQRMSDMLLERRNADWIDLLLREAPGKRVFIAAGAGHLPGDIGVLYLLEQEGFTIERLPMPRG